MNITIKGTVLVLLLNILSVSAYSQVAFTGTVVDKETNEPIPFAEVFFVELNTGRVTDENGVFTIEHQHPKNIEVQISFIGYNTLKTKIDMSQEQKQTFYLEPNHIELNEVVVSVPTGKLQNENVVSVEQKKITQLQQSAPATLAEAISNIPGVEQNTTGVGIGKPVIRGLTGNRIVTYAQGIRIENQQWGDEHGLGVGEAGIESVEVIKGPASLLYGSDALGGVLYFVDERYADHNTFEGYLKSNFLSNTLGSINTFGAKLHKEKLMFNLFGGYSTNADYTVPGNERVFNTRFDEKNVKAAIGFHKKNWITNVRYSYLQNNFGITDTSEYVTSVDRSFVLPFQKITNHNLSLENVLFTGNSTWNLMLGYTDNNRNEYEDSETDPALSMDLRTSTYNLKWNSPSYNNEKLNLIIGSQGMYQTNTNSGEEILIPDAKTIDLGGYAIVNYDLDNLQLQGGVRYDHRLIDTKEVVETGVAAFRNDYGSVNYSGGAALNLNAITLRANLSSGFRAPNTSELLSNGVHEGTNRFEKGNPNLKSEQATQFDFSFDFKNKHVEFTINPFINSIQNYIYLAPAGTFDQGVPVYNYLQSTALLTGGEMGVHYHPHSIHWLHIESDFSSIYAQDADKNPLPLIPANKWSTSLKVEFTSKKPVRLENVYVQNVYKFAQNRVGQFETVTPDYNLVNLGFNMAVGTGRRPFEINGGVKNVFNTKYIDHLSRFKPLGIPNPGINFFLGVKMGFEKKL